MNLELHGAPLISLMTMLSAGLLRPLLVAGAAFLCIRFFRIRHPAARHAVWALAMAGMLLTAFLSIVTPRVNVVVLHDATDLPSPQETHVEYPENWAIAATESTGQPDMEGPVRIRPDTDRDGVTAAASASGAPSNPPPSTGAIPSPGWILSWIYLAGVGVVAAYQTLGWFLLRRMLWRSKRVHGRLRESADVKIPVTVGFFRPAVILPSDWRTWSLHTRRLVLAHEFAHIRRRDLTVLCLTRWTRCLLWFNPVVWWTGRKLSQLAEMACDAAVMERTRNAAEYAHVLLQFAARLNGASAAEIPGFAMAKPSGLSERIDGVFEAAEGGPRRRSCPAALQAGIALVVIGLTSTLGVAQASRPIAPASTAIPSPLQNLQEDGNPEFPSPLPMTLAALAAEPAVQDLPATAGAGNPGSQIEGRVVDSRTGEPLSEVTVRIGRIGGASPEIAVRTDAAGRFAVDGIAPGRYQVRTQHESYAPVRDPDRTAPGNSGIWITIGPDERIADLVLALERWGIVTGQVFNAQGQPVAGAQVIAVRRGYGADGDPIYQGVQGGQVFRDTNDLGEFRFFQLESGEYYFFVNSQVYDLRQKPFSASFYPGTTDPSSSRPVQVTTGIELRLGPMTVLPDQGALLRVRVANLSGQPLMGNPSITTQIPHLAAERTTSVRSSSAPAPEVLEFPDITTGPQKILLQWETPAGRAIGHVIADVHPGVNDATVEVRLASRITGRILRNDPRLGLVPLEDIRCRFSAAGTLLPAVSVVSEADGSFSANGTAPGAYRPVCTNLPENTYIAAMLHGGTDVLDSGLQVTGDADVTLIVAAGGSLNGIATDSNGGPAHNAFVVLLPDTSDPDQQRFRSRRVMTDQHGTFAESGIAPGAYRVYAWRELDGLAYLNSEFMTPYRDRGRLVHIGAGERTQENVTLLER